MWKIIALCAFVGLAAGQKARYDKYKVYRMIPTTQTQLEILRQMENIDGVNFLVIDTCKYF